jgi:hypothetical protein
MILFLGIVSAQVSTLYVLDRSQKGILSKVISIPGSRLNFDADQVLLSNAQSFCLVESDIPGQAKFFIADRHAIYDQSVADGGRTISSNGDSGASFLTDIDHDGSNFFWADHRQNAILKSKKSIADASVLFRDTTLFPSSVVVSKSHDLIFWTDIKNNRMYRSGKDGSDPILLSRTNCQSPSRLTIDDSKRRIFWSEDGPGRIMSATFEGTDTKVLYQGEEGSYPYGIYFDPLDRLLYWTDYGRGTVMRIQPDQIGKAPELIADNLKTPLDLVVLHSSPLEKNFNAATSLGRRDVVVYPNPTINELHVSINPGWTNEAIKAEVMSMNGRVVLKVDGVLTPTFKLDTSGLPIGSYYLLISSKEKYLKRAFVKTRNL